MPAQHQDFRLAITYNNINNLKNMVYWLYLCCCLNPNNPNDYPIKEYTLQATSLPFVLPLSTAQSKAFTTAVGFLTTTWKEKVKPVGADDHTVMFVPISCGNLFLQVLDDILLGLAIPQE